MSHARIESLDARRHLSADSNLEGTVGFQDLVALAQSYNNGNSNAWLKGDFDYKGSVDFNDLVSLAKQYNGVGGSGDFAADWALAQSAFNPEVLADRYANLSNKGKLTIDMSIYNNARVFTEGRRTTVWLNTIGRHGAGATQEIIVRSFKGVKSIEVNGTHDDDSVTLFSGLRFTTVRTGIGNDTITGSDGESMLYGGVGNDRIYGGGGSDSLYGEAGDDRLSGEAGNDMLDGGVGKDRVDGGKGKNKIAGGSGTDYIKFRAGDKLDHKDRHEYLNETVD